jgi:hypothetical protein
MLPQIKEAKGTANKDSKRALTLTRQTETTTSK